MQVYLLQLNPVELGNVLSPIIVAAIGLFSAVAVALITTAMTALIDAWKERKKAKDLATNTDNTQRGLSRDSVLEFAQIFQYGLNLIDKTKCNIHRVWIMRTINGCHNPEFCQIVFGESVVKNAAIVHQEIPIGNDVYYQQILREIGTGKIVFAERKKVPNNSIVFRFDATEAKIANQTKYFQFYCRKMSDKSSEKWYISISTYEEFNDEDRLAIELYQAFATSLMKK